MKRLYKNKRTGIVGTIYGWDSEVEEYKDTHVMEAGDGSERIGLDSDLEEASLDDVEQFINSIPKIEFEPSVN